MRLSNFSKRTQDVFKISQSVLNRIINMNKSSNDNTSNDKHKQTEKRARKAKLDSLQKDLIKRYVYKFYERNEIITID